MATEPILISSLREKWEINKHYDMLPATIGYHNRVWDKILAHFGDVRIDTVTHDCVIGWRNDLFSAVKNNDVLSVERTRSTNTIARRIRDACSYFRFAKDLGLLSVNPFEFVKCKSSSVPPSSRVLTEEEVRKIIGAVKSQKLKMLIALCFYAGLRRSEAARLTMSDVNICKNRLTVLPPGGRTSTKHKKREVYMCSELIRIIQSYIHIGTLAGGVSERSSWNYIRKAAKDAGVSQQDLCLQLMRSSRENIWMAKYPPNVVTSWMGHNAQIAASYYRAVPESYYASEKLEMPIDNKKFGLRLCV